MTNTLFIIVFLFLDLIFFLIHIYKILIMADNNPATEAPVNNPDDQGTNI